MATEIRQSPLMSDAIPFREAHPLSSRRASRRGYVAKIGILFLEIAGAAGYWF